MAGIADNAGPRVLTRVTGRWFEAQTLQSGLDLEITIAPVCGTQEWHNTRQEWNPTNIAAQEHWEGREGANEHYYIQGDTRYELIQTEIIGWTERTAETEIVKGGQTLLFFKRQVDIRETPAGAQYYYTDSIFPVVVWLLTYPNGTEDTLPLVKTQDEFFIEYKDTNLLFLVNKPGIESNEVLVSLDRVNPRDSEFNIQSESAVLVCLQPVRDTKASNEGKMRYFGSISQILDFQNPNYPFIGLFGGSHYPIPRYRLLFDMSREDCLRFQFKKPVNGTPIDIPRMPRVGYLVSKDSLLCVAEKDQDYSEDHSRIFASLLKESTFVILESGPYVVLGYNIKRTICKIQLPINPSPFMIPYPFTIVIIPEGVNTLRIQPYKHKEHNAMFNYKRSWLYQRDGDTLLSAIDWIQFQQDFQSIAIPFEYSFRLIMERNEIYDYIEHRIAMFDPRQNMHVSFPLLFSMRGLSMIMRRDEFHEHWNVYMPIDSPTNDSWIYMNSFHVINRMIRGSSVSQPTQLFYKQSFANTTALFGPDIPAYLQTLPAYAWFAQYYNTYRNQIRNQLRNNENNIWQVIAGTQPNDFGQAAYYMEQRYWLTQIRN